jgi:hypothetical protein
MCNGNTQTKTLKSLLINMNRAFLERVVQGQAERNITEKSKKDYLS